MHKICKCASYITDLNSSVKRLLSVLCWFLRYFRNYFGFIVWYFWFC